MVYDEPDVAIEITRLPIELDKKQEFFIRVETKEDTVTFNTTKPQQKVLELLVEHGIKGAKGPAKGSKRSLITPSLAAKALEEMVDGIPF